MVWLLKVFLLIASTAAPDVSPSLVNGQEQEPLPEPSYEFVSGTVTELPAGRIVINRAVLGKPPENRSFLIKPETKIEGRLRLHARVTVGFKPSDEGDVAVRIIVRAQNEKKP
jgi:hypothetical protein